MDFYIIQNLNGSRNDLKNTKKTEYVYFKIFQRYVLTLSQ